MSAYLTTLLTSTTSRYTTLRRTLLPGTDETDGDTEDDSHIARCLRAYYTEKNRPFPDWLPPDPKKPLPPVQHQQQGYGYGYSDGYGGQQQGGYGYQRGAGVGVGGRYGSGSSASGPGSMGGRSGGMSDPYDGSAGAGSSSLRAGRGDRFGAGGAAGQRLTPGGGRPLPSSREGSMQGRFGEEGGGGISRPGAGAAGAGSTQDRLKARLFGGGGAPGGLPGGGGSGGPGGPGMGGSRAGSGGFR